VDYEWDPVKSRANLSKHGVRLADAAGALEDEFALTIRDPDCDEEERWITLGMDSVGRFLVVVWTLRANKVRIISARKATARERHVYEKSDET
jgi:uncharacterized protein